MYMPETAAITEQINSEIIDIAMVSLLLLVVGDTYFLYFPVIISTPGNGMGSPLKEGLSGSKSSRSSTPHLNAKDFCFFLHAVSILIDQTDEYRKEMYIYLV